MAPDQQRSNSNGNQRWIAIAIAAIGVAVGVIASSFGDRLNVQGTLAKLEANQSAILRVQDKQEETIARFQLTLEKFAANDRDMKTVKEVIADHETRIRRLEGER